MITGPELPLLTLVLLIAASFVAGWVDSIVGGGGLIQLPSLLIGLPEDTPVATIAGSNKVPSAMGTAVAAWTYTRKVAVERNGDIVPRSRHVQHTLHEHDKVEIVQAIGGG